MEVSRSAGAPAPVVLMVDGDGDAARLPVAAESGPVQLLNTSGNQVALRIDLAGVESHIRRLIVGCEIGPVRVNAPLVAHVRDHLGELLVTCRTDVHPQVRAVGVLELLRDRDAWTCRQLATSYNNGVTAFLADHGADASDSPDAPVLTDDAPKARSGDLVGGRYELDRVLGSGAMGDVWLAADKRLGRRVAVKHFRAGHASSQRARQRMLREARIAARIDHRHAVVVHDLVIETSVPYLVMQYIDGLSLAEHIDRSALRVDEAARIGLQVAGALAAAHSLGIVHRDVKPANILMDERFDATLGDFGVAREVGDASLTLTGYVIGTPAYLAPEIARGGTADQRSDVYSLGATLWNAVEGAAPFMKDRPNPLAVLARVLSDSLPDPDHGGELRPLIRAMTDPAPDRRPSAAEVEEALTEVTGTPLDGRDRHGEVLPSVEPSVDNGAPPTAVERADGRAESG